MKYKSEYSGRQEPKLTVTVTLDQFPSRKELDDLTKELFTVAEKHNQRLQQPQPVDKFDFSLRYLQLFCVP